MRTREEVDVDPLFRTSLPSGSVQCTSSLEANIEDSTDSGKGGGDPMFTTDVGTCLRAALSPVRLGSLTLTQLRGVSLALNIFSKNDPIQVKYL